MTENNLELRTSAEWQRLFPNVLVVDPDGWNRKNYQFSWNEELITKEEYDKRVSFSTTRRKIVFY